jgi:hypothetical protein
LNDRDGWVRFMAYRAAKFMSGKEAPAVDWYFGAEADRQKAIEPYKAWLKEKVFEAAAAPKPKPPAPAPAPAPGPGPVAAPQPVGNPALTFATARGASDEVRRAYLASVLGSAPWRYWERDKTPASDSGSEDADALADALDRSLSSRRVAVCAGVIHVHPDVFQGGEDELLSLLDYARAAAAADSMRGWFEQAAGILSGKRTVRPAFRENTIREYLLHYQCLRESPSADRHAASLAAADEGMKKLGYEHRRTAEGFELVRLGR